MDDDKGTSLIFVNSGVGREIFKRISDDLKFEEVDVNESVKYNSPAIQSAKHNPNRDGFMAAKDMLPFDKLVTKYCNEPLQIRVMNKLKSGIKKILVKTKLIKIVDSTRK